MSDAPWDSPEPLRLGNTGEFSGYEGFQGKVADLIFWSDTALSEAEVTRLNSNGWEVAPDTVSPVITFNNNPVVIAKDSDWDGFSAETVLSAYDAVDGDLTYSVSEDSNNVQSNLAGDYAIEYSVSDAAGNSTSEILTVSVKEMYQIPNDDTTLSTPSSDSGWTSGGGVNVVEYSGLTEYTLTLTGESPENVYLISGNRVTYGTESVLSVKTFDNLIDHDYLRVKFNYLGIHAGTGFSVRVDGQTVWSASTHGDSTSVDSVTGGEITEPGSWASHTYFPVDFVVPHTQSSAEITISVPSFESTRYAFSPIQLYLDTNSSSAVNLTYAMDVEEGDTVMIFVDGSFVEETKYSLSSGSITFASGVLNIGSEIACVKVL